MARRRLGRYFNLLACVATCLVVSTASAQAKWAQPLGAALLAKINYFSADGSDPLHPQTQDGEAGRMFAPIGRYTTNNLVPFDLGNGVIKYGRSRGTAFLISPCYIMTNYHVVYGELRSQPDKDSDYTGTFETAGRNILARPAAYSELYKDEQSDWAVMHLSECIGEQIGWLNLQPVNSASLHNLRLSTAGFPADHDDRHLWVQDNCKIYDHWDTTISWETDCAMSHGLSGSPIYTVKNGQVFVVAIGKSWSGGESKIYRQFDKDHANFMVDVGGAEVEEPGIAKIVDFDIRRFAGPNHAFEKQQ